MIEVAAERRIFHYYESALPPDLPEVLEYNEEIEGLMYEEGKLNRITKL
jgi:hypothetical protein